jgi:hypothetical protein
LKGEREKGKKNHSTQDSHVVPHHGTNWAALRLTAQIGRDAVLSESYGRGYWYSTPAAKYPLSTSRSLPARSQAPQSGARPKEKSEQRKGKKGRRAASTTYSTLSYKSETSPWKKKNPSARRLPSRNKRKGKPSDIHGRNQRPSSRGTPTVQSPRPRKGVGPPSPRP